MKMNEQKFVYIFTIIISFVLMIDNFYPFLENVWIYFLLNVITLQNAFQLSKINKKNKNIN